MNWLDSMQIKMLQCKGVNGCGRKGGWQIIQSYRWQLALLDPRYFVLDKILQLRVIEHEIAMMICLNMEIDKIFI